MGDTHHDEEFEGTDTGASKTFPMQAGAVRKGTHVLLKGKPCKVSEISISKTGKHGHAKAHIVGNDIFTAKKYEDLCPTSHNMESPVVNRVEFTVADIQADDFVTLLNEKGDMKEDLALPNDEISADMVAGLREKFENPEDGKELKVVVLVAMGQEKIVEFKMVNPGN